MAKTMNQKSFWFGWIAVVIFLSLLYALNTVILFTVGDLLRNPIGGYLTAGLVTYMANPRYWVLEYNQDIPHERDIWILFAWPVKLPYYTVLIVIAGLRKLTGK